MRAVFFVGFLPAVCVESPLPPFAKGETQSGEKKGPEFCVW